VLAYRLRTCTAVSWRAIVLALWMPSPFILVSDYMSGRQGAR
jgi:hypothetical protein